MYGFHRFLDFTDFWISRIFLFVDAFLRNATGHNHCSSGGACGSTWGTTCAPCTAAAGAPRCPRCRRRHWSDAELSGSCPLGFSTQIVLVFVVKQLNVCRSIVEIIHHRCSRQKQRSHAYFWGVPKWWKLGVWRWTIIFCRHHLCWHRKKGWHETSSGGKFTNEAKSVAGTIRLLLHV